VLLKPSVTAILLPESGRLGIINHCQQALKAHDPESAAECKAFGLICGTLAEGFIRVEECQPLRQNMRSLPPYKDYMDRIMAEHAFPSRTPLHQRGWVADPAELTSRLRESSEKGCTLLGTYHMHRVPWRHDPLRDTPTGLDALLARDSRLLTFIISVVDPANPIIRAFYEGKKEREIPIAITGPEEIRQVDESRKTAGADR
jgi:hypothetical protein